MDADNNGTQSTTEGNPPGGAMSEPLSLAGEAEAENTAPTADDEALTRDRAVRELPRPNHDSQRDIAAHVDLLARIALEQEDPVAALEEGAIALAEALAARDLAREQAAQLTQDRSADLRDAHRHARLHRVGELVDIGYNLDHAVMIAEMDEAEIRARAARAGRDSSETIYRYALLHGYRPRIQTALPSPNDARPRQMERVHRPSLEMLAAMNDEEFATATKGERWQQLLRTDRL